MSKKSANNSKYLLITALAGVVLLSIYLINTNQNPQGFPDINLNDNLPNTDEIVDSTDSESELPGRVSIANVPFTSQAPSGDWTDPRQQNGCEEASALMAGKWMNNQTIDSPASALEDILAMSSVAEEMFGTSTDSSAGDTLKLFQRYFKTTSGKLINNVSIAGMKRELAEGRVLIVPANGQKLNNPNFTGGGPERHMLVVIGYDDRSQTFITNDPGTRKGKNYPYSYNVLYESIRDYPTGDHQPFYSDGDHKTVIAVGKI